MTRLIMLWVLGIAMFSSQATFGQAYPSRPIRMVIPFPPAGSIDTVARAIVERWMPRLHENIVVDNRGGAGGTIGTELVARSTPDGYTILYGNLGPLSIGPNLYSKLGYNLFKNLTPVSLVANAPLILFSSTELPVKSIGELINYAKERPGKLNYASSGVGSGLHLGMELFKSVTGLNIVHVPYKGLSQAIPDIAGGRIQLIVYTYAGARGFLKAGLVKALVTGGTHRSPALPDVPTGAEAGLPGFQATAWHAIVAPAGTPKSIILSLQRMLAATLSETALRDRLIRDDVDPVGSTPNELGEFMHSEFTKWGGIIKSLNLQVN